MPLSASEHRFIDEMAALLEPWGMARSIGRVYAFMLLRAEPVAVEIIASELRMSRSNAWIAVRALESFGHIGRRGAQGSKKALFFQSDNYAAPVLRQTALLAAMGSLLRQAAGSIAEGNAAMLMRRRAAFYLTLRKAIAASLDSMLASAGALRSSQSAKKKKP